MAPDRQAYCLPGAYFLSFAFIGVFAPYFSLYLHAGGLAAQDIATLIVAMQSMRLLAPALWGILADRRGMRGSAIGLSVLGSLCGLSALMATESFGGMFLAMVVLSFFWSATPPLLETATFAHIGDRPPRYAAIRLWGSLGTLAAALTVGQLLDTYPVGIVPWTCWLILLALLPVSFMLPAATPGRPSRGETWLQFRQALAQPAVVGIVSAGFFMAAAHGALTVFYSIHLAQQGYQASTIGLLWALGVATEIAFFMLMPRLSHRLASNTLWMLCFAAAALRFSLIGWWVEWIAVAVFAQLLHALSFAAHHALSVSFINRSFPGKHAARGQTLYATCQGAGALAGGLSSGFLWGMVGGSWTFTASAILALAGMLIAGFSAANAIGGSRKRS